MLSEKVNTAFNHYNKTSKISISRAEFEKNLTLKMNSHEFLRDGRMLLSDRINWTPKQISASVMDRLVSKLVTSS